MDIYTIIFSVSFLSFFVCLFFFIRSLYRDIENFVLHMELFFIGLFAYIVSWSTQLSVIPLLSSDVPAYYGFVVLFNLQSVFLFVLFLGLVVALILLLRQTVQKR